MSIETLLTLVVAASILMGALFLRTLARAGIKLFVMVREWVRPAPARHRARAPRGAPLPATVTRSPSRH